MTQVVLEELRVMRGESIDTLSAETPLIGDASVLDSMGLVELCLRLEDRAGELGFVFDWTSEKALSQTQGMFRSVQSLQEEFDRQLAVAS